MRPTARDDLERAIAAGILFAYGTIVLILWPLERLTRRRRGQG